MKTQKETADPNRNRMTLAADGHLLELPTWQAEFLYCDTDDIGATGCVSQKNQEVTFPAQSVFAGLDKKKLPNRAILQLKLTPEIKSWIAKHNFVALALPRSVQNSVKLKNINTAVHGSGVNVTFTLNAENLTLNDALTLDIDFDGYPWFGPAELPPALLSADRVDEYHGLFLRQKNGADLARQIEIGIPLMLAAIALVLDHTLIFGALSLYAGASAWRSFLSFQRENLVAASEWSGYLSTIVNGFVLVLFLHFMLQILEIKMKRVYYFLLLILFIGFVSSFLLANKFHIDRSILNLSADSLADSLACALATLLVLYSIFTCLTDWRADGRWQDVSLKLLRNFIILFAVIVHGYMNFSDLIQISTSQLKNVLDWKHSLLLPCFTTAALLEVGSTSKKMLTYGKEMAKKSAYEKDLAMGQEIQRRMLPKVRGSLHQASWRSLYKPAQALSGDWFDIREIVFANGQQVLVACVADVTGHGVGSSLTTSVISSHWGVWCEQLERHTSTPDLTHREHLICTAAGLIHKGLQALRQNELCTAVFLIAEPSSGWITVLSAAHPGLVVEWRNTLHYLTTPGDRLGASDTLPQSWIAKSEQYVGKSNLFLFSDGIQPPRTGLSRWISVLKRNNAGKPTVLQMAQQVQRNVRAFALNEQDADDQTLLAISMDTET